MNRLQVGDECYVRDKEYSILNMSDEEIFSELDKIKQRIRYDSETGDLVFIKKSGKINPGDTAGYIHHMPKSDMFYRKVYFAKSRIGAHVLCWMLHYGEIPKKHIDHINGNTLDNRIKNLRCAGYELNSKNRRMRKDNKSGVTGVIIHNGKYRAEIKSNGKSYHLGCFDTIELAKEARDNAKRSLGFTEWHGEKRNPFPCAKELAQ
jgi:hypothetical protein